MNDAILHAIFGDGCAVAVVGGRTARSAEPGSLAVLDNRSWLVSNAHPVFTNRLELVVYFPSPSGL